MTDTNEKRLYRTAMGYLPSNELYENPSTSEFTAGPSLEVHAVAAVAPDCDLCIPDCDDEECAAAEACTDDCFVVPCDDPSHADTSCACEFEQMDDYYGPGLYSIFGGGATLTSSLKTSPSAPAFAPLPISPAYHPDNSHSWDAALAAFMCESCKDVFPPTFLQQPGSPPLSETTVFSSPALSNTPDIFYSGFSSPAAQHSQQQIMQPGPFYDFTASGSQNFQLQPAAPGVTCMWAGCYARFSSFEELVGHVNLLHLRPGAVPSSGRPASPSILCQWDNCHEYPTFQSTANTSPSETTKAALDVLQEHLYHDHLGIGEQQQTFNMTDSPHASHAFSFSPTLLPPKIPPPTISIAPPHESFTPLPKSNTTSFSSPKSTSSGSLTAIDKAVAGAEGDGENVICRWIDCGIAFSSTEELTSHLTTEHVGGGKAHYECYWNGCQRHGERGFTSKQKICRHLQSHTGHRPFQCKLCKQHFSEAATLQQHMRRHTQEKPYLCDVPGCNKAFAIAGALTIHKRTHNGDKPFKCTYCDRAFAESSNLSKHLRTHTGIRPYACSEPGCSKAFSRPDQLARHQSIHKR